MKSMRKLALVPVDEWERLKGKKISNLQTVDVPHPQTSPTTTTTATAMTAKKKKTLPSTSSAAAQPPDDWMTTRTRGRRRRSQEEDNEMSGVEETMTKGRTPSRTLLTLEDFSVNKRRKAKKLLTLLKKSGHLNFTSKMELVYHGKVVKNSNIISLIEHALSKNNKKPIKGMRRFYTLLQSVGIPNTLVRNKWGRQLVKRSKTISV
jgi:hypothetical protein